MAFCGSCQLKPIQASRDKSARDGASCERGEGEERRGRREGKREERERRGEVKERERERRGEGDREERERRG